VVVGLGSEFRGDDGVGLIVAEELRRRNIPGVKVYSPVSDGSSLIHLWENTDLCIVVDCAVSGQPVGTIHCFDALADELPDELFCRYSTHAYSISDALSLSRILECLPGHLIVYGIEGDRFTCGAEMSSEVKSAAHHLIQHIRAVITSQRRPVPYYA
jgi:hydrogenase maturation protease